MKINLTNQKENKFLGRKEFLLTVEFEKNSPSYPELKKAFSELIKAEENRIAVKNIYPLFGQRKAKAEVYLYENEEILRQIEPKEKEKKKT